MPVELIYLRIGKRDTPAQLRPEDLRKPIRRVHRCLDKHPGLQLLPA